MSFVNFLLDKGAVPNSGGFGPLSNLYLAAKGQPMGLVQKKVERGADIHDDAAIKQATEAGRKDVVECLVQAATRTRCHCYWDCGRVIMSRSNRKHQATLEV